MSNHIRSIDTQNSVPSTTPEITNSQNNRSEKNRITVALPVRNGNREQWEMLGVKWAQTISGNPFVVNAQLPIGWSVSENPNVYFDKKDFVILDSTDTPRVTVWFKLASDDQYERVDFLTDKEAIEIKEELKNKASKYNQVPREQIRRLYSTTTAFMMLANELYRRKFKNR